MATAKKQATAKKTTAKKTTAKKQASAKKATAKKTTAKKTTAKKATAKTQDPAAKKRNAAKREPAAKQPAKKQPSSRDSAIDSDSLDLPALLRIRDELRAYAFGLPGAWEDHPWGESVAKVGKKVFVFFGTADPAHLHEGVRMSVKLPCSGDLVLALPFAVPTGYGLGRSGWVSVALQPADLPPMPMLTAWIDESYRAVAPKKQVAALDSRRP